MDLICYPLLGTRSRRALKREKTNFGHRYHYNPRGNLLSRLAQDLGMTTDAVHAQLMKERAYLIKHTKFL